MGGGGRNLGTGLYDGKPSKLSTKLYTLCLAEHRKLGRSCTVFVGVDGYIGLRRLIENPFLRRSSYALYAYLCVFSSLNPEWLAFVNGGRLGCFEKA